MQELATLTAAVVLAMIIIVAISIGYALAKLIFVFIVKPILQIYNK